MSNHYSAFRKAEREINKHLFWVCAGVTVLVMVMVITQFFTQGAFPSPNIDLFYIGVLVIYSIHKELLRWLGEKEIERQGEYFVYSWIILTALFYLVNFLSKGYFNGAGESGQSDTLRDTS